MSHPHLVSYIGRDDVDLVLGRLPADLRARLRGVHLTSANFAVRRVGWVSPRGRREITLCAMLPPRVSLRGYMFRGRIASDFGAPWPSDAAPCAKLSMARPCSSRVIRLAA